MRALHGRGERRSPDMGVQQDAPTNETTVLSTFCEINKIKHQGIEEKAKNNRKAQAVS